MDNTAIQRFKDALSQHDRVAVVVGKTPSLDQMAAALALHLSLKAANKASSIASLSQPIVEHSSLVAIDEVRGSIGSAGGDLVVSFPYQEGEIEKVSYTIENGLLNIVVKAGENGLTFQEQDVKFTRGGGMPSLIIVVGVAHISDLGEMLQVDGLREATIVNVDINQANEGYGDIVLLAPQYSSLSEYMANLVLSNGLSLDIDAAQNLMNGISYATGNFQSPSMSYFTFEIVAELMRRGAVRVQAAQQPQTQPGFMQTQQQSMPQPQPQAQPMPQPQPMQQPQGQPRNQGQQRQQMPRPNFNQQRNNQQGGQRSGQRGNQPQRQQQNQNNRQDEIRRALAEQARAMQANQMNNQMNQQPQTQPQPMVQPPVQPMPEPMPQPQAQPMPQPQPMQQPGQPVEAPSDWLTPKVYKGSSNPS